MVDDYPIRLLSKQVDNSNRYLTAECWGLVFRKVIIVPLLIHITTGNNQVWKGHSDLQDKPK